MWANTSKQAEDSYESFGADYEEKTKFSSADEAAKQVKKISGLMNKAVRKKIDAETKEIDTGRTLYPGRVSGKSSGVKKALIDALLEVSSHYEGTVIHVVSGLRNRPNQAKLMYASWDKHLNKFGKNGGIYVFLRQSKNQELWKELDDFHAAKDQSGFVKCMMQKAPWKEVSRHLTGEAVDISLQTEKRILDALKMVIKHYLAEKDGNSEGIKCHHFDNKYGINKVDDKLRANLWVLGQQFMRLQRPIRLAGDNIGKGASSIDPKLPLFIAQVTHISLQESIYCCFMDITPTNYQRNGFELNRPILTTARRKP